MVWERHKTNREEHARASLKYHNARKNNPVYLEKRRKLSLARYHANKCSPDFRNSRNEYRWEMRGIVNRDGSRFLSVDYDRAYQIQSGNCKICGKHASLLSRPLCADHDHTTGKFRGLLCFGCNIFLGQYERIKDYAAEYLK